MARGRGASLDLRLFVAACVMTPAGRKRDTGFAGHERFAN